MGVQATFYVAPQGETKQIEIFNVYPEDEAWFNSTPGEISMEELSTGDFAVYYDTGLVDDEDEPVEFLALAKGRSCHETLAELRSISQRYLEEHP